MNIDPPEAELKSLRSGIIWLQTIEEKPKPCQYDNQLTRFGMTVDGFQQLAQLMVDVILKGKTVKAEVCASCQRFLEMKYCFSGDEFEGLTQKPHKLI